MSYGCAHCGVIEPDLQQVAEIVESTEKIFRVNIALDGNLPIFTRSRDTHADHFLNGAIVGAMRGKSRCIEPPGCGEATIRFMK